jgi:hypothetical protein
VINVHFVLVGALFNGIGSATYLFRTLRGSIQPNRITWALWALAPLIAFGAEISEGVGLVALLTFMAGFGPLLIFLASFANKASYWRLGRFDWTCAALSALALIGWAASGKADVAIILSISADLFAALPTLRKAYLRPDTESAVAFLAVGIGGVIATLSSPSISLRNAGFPIYIGCLGLTLAILLAASNLLKRGSGGLNRAEELRDAQAD